MGEEFQAGICGGNWWNPSKTVFMGGLSACSQMNTSGHRGTYGSWMTDMVDLKPKSCKESNNSVLHTSTFFQNSLLKSQQTDDSGSGSGSILMDSSTLQTMGFGLSSSSSSSDWNQALLPGSGRGGSYNSMLQQEDINNSSGGGLNSPHNHQIQKEWSPKSFTSTAEDSSISAFKAINQDFSLDQPRLPSSPAFSMESAAASYCYPSSSTLIQSLFEPDPPHHHQPHHQSLLINNTNMNYLSNPPNYATNLNELSPYLKPSLTKRQHTALNFSNNTPFWNPSATALNDNVRASFLPSSQPQFLVPTFEEKPNCSNLNTKANNAEVRDSESVVKKRSDYQPAIKRPRIETPSPVPTFKVRKEKLGDRITALQQLVSPFGKTDTASVLHEAIEYIKFLHEQVSLLSAPYMKNGNPIQHHQVADILKGADQGAKQDLRSRGLCLVPISSTFPVANETTASFWTPTFGCTFR